MNISTIITSLTLVATIAGGVYFVEGRYQLHQEAAEVHAGLNLQYYQTKEDQIKNRIFDLKVQKRKMGSSWPTFMQKELERQEKELQRIERKIRQYLK